MYHVKPMTGFEPQQSAPSSLSSLIYCIINVGIIAMSENTYFLKYSLNCRTVPQFLSIFFLWSDFKFKVSPQKFFLVALMSINWAGYLYMKTHMSLLSALLVEGLKVNAS